MLNTNLRKNLVEITSSEERLKEENEHLFSELRFYKDKVSSDKRSSMTSPKKSFFKNDVYENLNTENNDNKGT